MGRLGLYPPELLLVEELPGMIDDAVSFTCSTTRLMTLRARGIAAAPAAAPAAAATAMRRLRVLAAFLPALARLVALLPPARRAEPVERFFDEDFREDLRELPRDDDDLFFELFFELLLELRFFEDFFEDFFEPFFDAMGSLLFKASLGEVRDLKIRADRMQRCNEHQRCRNQFRRTCGDCHA